MIKKVFNAVIFTALMVLLYFLWTQNTHIPDLAIMGILGFFVFCVFHRNIEIPLITPRRIFYIVFYIFYLLWEIVKSNLDVAKRVIAPVVRINPGIVRVKTTLKSPVARMFLANSITLTPGTLTVDIKGNDLFIHWIDVSDVDEIQASKVIVAGFEKYLEVIFG